MIENSFIVFNGCLYGNRPGSVNKHNFYSLVFYKPPSNSSYTQTYYVTPLSLCCHMDYGLHEETLWAPSQLALFLGEMTRILVSVSAVM